MQAEVILARLEGKFDAHLAKQDVILAHLVERSDNHDKMIHGEPPESFGLHARVNDVAARVTKLESTAARRLKMRTTALLAFISAVVAWLVNSITDLARK